MVELIKKYFKWFLILVIIIITVAVLISKCGGKVKEFRTEKKENKQVIENTQKSDSLEAVVSTLQQQRAVNDAKDSLARIASNRLISYWKSKALNSRARVDTVIQSNPDLKEAFEDSDSLLAVTEARNKALEKEKADQRKDSDKVIKIQEEQLNLNQGTISILAGQRDRYRKKADKRFVVGPVISIDYQLKPSIGIGLQYRVFRF